MLELDHELLAGRDQGSCSPPLPVAPHSEPYAQVVFTEGTKAEVFGHICRHVTCSSVWLSSLCMAGRGLGELCWRGEQSYTHSAEREHGVCSGVLKHHDVLQTTHPSHDDTV